MNKEEIRKREEYARKLVELEGTATYGFLREYGRDVLDEIEDKAGREYERVLRVEDDDEMSNRVQGVLYSYFENTGFLNSVNSRNSRYRVEADEEEVKLFKEQLEEDLDETYGEYELIAKLKVAADHLEEDGIEADSASDYLERIDEPKSGEPFKREDSFGSLTNALWRAGLETNEELDNELALQKLRKAVHEKNKNNDNLVSTLSVSEAKDSNITYSQPSLADKFGSFENAYKQARLETVRSIEKDLKTWNQIVSPYHRRTSIYKFTQPADPSFSGIYPKTDFSSRAD